MKSSEIELSLMCDQNWKNMSPVDGGRFCHHCQKRVIDFSNMNTHEIKEYFSQHQTTDLCGNFKRHQLHESLPGMRNKIMIMYRQFSESNQSRKTLMFFLGLLILISGCARRVRGKISHSSFAHHPDVKVEKTEMIK